MSEHMVIIGAGEAGSRAAFALRELGFAGSVTLIGEEMHLPYERPPLSKDALTTEDAPGPKTIATVARFEASAITCLTGIKVHGIDRVAKRVHLSDGRTLAYHRLLLATGASARRIILPGDGDDRHCVTLRRFEDVARLRGHFRPRARIAIIGGGFIGLEVAASAIQRGAGVIVHPFGRAMHRRLVVVAENGDRALLHQRANGIDHIGGVGPVADEVAEKDDAIRLVTDGMGEAGVQRLAVGMNVREKSDAHAGPGPDQPSLVP